MIVVTSDLIVGVFSRDQLSTGLVTIHRSGFGPQARVLDSARGPLDVQLGKTGFQIAASFAAGDTDTALILISAPGRTERVAAALTGAGARAVYLAARAGADLAPSLSLVPEPVVIDELRPPPAESYER